MEKIKEVLNKDVKEYNLKLLIISGIVFIALMGFISYKLTNNSYALFIDEVNGTKTITLHYDPARVVTFDPDGGTIPQGTKWTGSGNSATKEVTTGLKYGDLPTPTKEGYTFKGWNGKNLFPESDLVNSTVWRGNQNVQVTKTDEYVQVLYNQNDSTPGYIYFPANTFLVGGHTYTITINAKGVGTTVLYMGLYNNSIGYTITTNEFNVYSKTITFNAQTTNQYILLYEYLTPIQEDRIGTGFQIKWVMMEEGSNYTGYEPYYVTEDTKVTQTSNHTLKAIWEEN